MKRLLFLLFVLLACFRVNAQERRPVDSRHPMWLVHVDVWNKADPQKIINLIPEDLRPYVVMNLSLSCQYDTEKNVYKMPQNAVKTYKSWGSVCQQNGMWFTCQPASGGHTHIQDDDLETFEYFYKQFPNFLGWNYAEQFWGFDEANDKSSSTQASRIALFAKLVPMAHKYGGFLTISFCGNIWSHPLNPVGMMKRNSDLLNACKQYPEAILWLYKYTTSSCFYNNESVTYSPFISGLAKNYGVRYDNCGWNGALDAILKKDHGKKYPVAAGIGTVMEQTCVNGGAVWDGPELIWTEDFKNANNTTVDGYQRRMWEHFPGFTYAWLDMFRKIVNGTMYIPSREEVIDKTKIVVVNNVSTGSDEQKYAAWGDLYDGLYKQTDPFNPNTGQWMENYCYFKKTGRYGAIPVAIGLYDSLARTIPVQVKKSLYSSRWSTQAKKVAEFDKYYPEMSKGDLYVNRFRNQIVTYTPYSYLNKKKNASAQMPLLYNTCDSLKLNYGKLSSGIIHEYADHIDFYLNNYRSDTITLQTDEITIVGATAEPVVELTNTSQYKPSYISTWSEETGVCQISVKHNGPLTLTVKCSGAAQERKTDYVSNTALELPKQPEEYYGPVTIEAEDMDYKSIKSCVTDPYTWYPNVRGHAGNGFMDMGTSTSGALKHVMKIKRAGNYKVNIRYSNASKASSLLVNVGAKRLAAKISKTATNEWLQTSLTFSFKEGDNNLIITNYGGVGMYIDNVTYCPEDVEAEKYAVLIREAEHGKVVADVDSAAEGEKVSLTVIPEDGYKLVSWKIIHGSVVMTEDGTFTMPDDNVTIQPVFKDVSLVYSLDFSDVLNGTVPEGWRCTQEDSQVHEYPNSYTSGSRVFSGFSGYQGKALYWREGTAEYGRQTSYPLTLEPGDYSFVYAMAAWKSTPKYKAQILDASGSEVVASSSLLASPNAGGNSAASVRSAVSRELTFNVGTKGKYYIVFTNLNVLGDLDEFLLLDCKIRSLTATAVEDIQTEEVAPEGIYTVNGIKIPNLRKGMNIIRTKNGTVRKVFK